jgi:hypothetical protein
MATNEELQSTIDELETQLTTARGSQAGSDRTVTELQARIAELEGAADQDPDKPDPALELIERKTAALTLAIDKGLDPADVFAMLGIDDADDAQRIEAMANFAGDTETATTKRILKQNGRNPFAGGGLKMTAPTLEEISNMSDVEQRNLDSDVIAAAIEKNAQAGQRTLRDSILGSR